MFVITYSVVVPMDYLRSKKQFNVAVAVAVAAATMLWPALKLLALRLLSITMFVVSVYVTTSGFLLCAACAVFLAHCADMLAEGEDRLCTHPADSQQHVYAGCLLFLQGSRALVAYQVPICRR